MGIHFDKIIPVIIAVILIYLNIKKKSKKQNTAPKPASDESGTTQPSSGHETPNPFFKGLENFLDMNQPVVQTVPEPEQRVIKPKTKKETGVHEPVVNPAPVTKPVVQEPVVDSEHFDFDARRAIIDAEIMNRKYFSI